MVIGRRLGLTESDMTRALAMEATSTTGWRKAPFKEPGFIDPSEEQPRRMERLCFRALAERAIGESKAAEILGISVRELSRRMDHPSPG